MTEPSTNRKLLATWTSEPFQPVRLYYTVPSRAFVIKRLRKLKCMVDVPDEGLWQWIFEAEAASLRFAGGYDDVPPELRPIIIGRIRVPRSGGMTLETNSVARAIAAARFFGPRLGPDVVALRCRVVNRCFAADEGTPSELRETLDQDVTVVDPRQAEERFKREFKAVRSMEDFNRAAAASMERRIRENEDVPLVEDFPLAPEEETPDFKHLATTLDLRFVRAFEHWRGNTHLTLAAIIMRAVGAEQGPRGGEHA
jgi:hypothetical protein